jgi:transcriptional regulator with XRE-family HTH domain
MPRSNALLESKALKLLRALLGWEQEELAAAVGLSRSAIARLENSPPRFSRERLEQLAQAMNAPPGLLEAALALAVQSHETTEPGIKPSSEKAVGGVLGTPTPMQASALGEAVAAGALALDRFLRERLWDAYVAEERKRAETLWHRLARRSPADRLLVVAHGLEYQCWALCEKVCAESVRSAARDAKTARELAELALAIARRVPGGAGEKGRAEGYALAFLANALRVSNQLPASEEAFKTAHDLFFGSGLAARAPLDAARLFDLEASLRRNQGRFAEALALLDRALALTTDRRSQARLLLNIATTHEKTGEPDSALVALRKAAGLMPDNAEPRFRCVLLFGLVSALLRAGSIAEAEVAFGELQRICLDTDNELDLLRIRWLGGRLSATRGRVEEALLTFREVRSIFVARALDADAALCALDEALLHLEAGRPVEARTLVREMRSIFATQGLDREGLAAVRVFLDSVEAEVATVHLGREALRAFTRALAR